MAEGVRHFRALHGVVEDEPEEREGDGNLESGEDGFFQTGKVGRRVGVGRGSGLVGCVGVRGVRE
jgi:hypothetical protein